MWLKLIVIDLWQLQDVLQCIFYNKSEQAVKLQLHEKRHKIKIAMNF